MNNLKWIAKICRYLWIDISDVISFFSSEDHLNTLHASLDYFVPRLLSSENAGSLFQDSAYIFCMMSILYGLLNEKRTKSSCPGFSKPKNSSGPFT